MCAVLFMSAGSAHADEGVREKLSEAVRLFEAIEYEQALSVLDQARKLPQAPQDAISLFLLRGIIRAELGQWKDARADFRAALWRSLEAELPLKVSPKVVGVFEFEREKALARQRAKKKGVAPPDVGVKTAAKTVLAESGEVSRGPLPASEVPPRPTLMPPEAPLASAEPRTPLLLPPSARPLDAERNEMGFRVAGRTVPLASLVLMGAGVAAGGSGVFFGLRSRSQVDAARRSMAEAEVRWELRQAQGSATTANRLWGTAGVAVAGALTTWLLFGSKEGFDTREGAR
ncbi:hypothetical protein [Myxococcus stipitatus]|uniref:hypothetical protein n=1 Tax=Myxococcus stipitatus TaxID=83455 RepID=UPI000693811B|nr:hypothetical protein [Myxococcus stipitatus]